MAFNHGGNYSFHEEIKAILSSHDCGNFARYVKNISICIQMKLFRYRLAVYHTLNHLLLLFTCIKIARVINFDLTVNLH